MLSPVDAKVVLKVGDEELTLRLNWRALAMAKKEGVSILAGGIQDELDLAMALKCLAHQDHPDLDIDVAFAWFLAFPVEVRAAIEKLLEDWGGIVEGNRPAPEKKPAPKKTTKRAPKTS